MTTRVSVIVPTADRPHFLRVALASIRALEGPDLSFEILVGDNGTSEETPKVVAEFGATYIRVNEKGASAGRNAGLRAASSEFIAFLDDDDAWMAGHIRPHLEKLQANPELDAVLAQVIYADYELAPFYGDPWPDFDPGQGDDMLRRMLSGWFPQIGTLVARTRVREKVGFFDPALVGGQDLDWMMRIARKRGLGFHATPCVLFRGRPAGSYDALQRRRVKFDRQVFLRHAVPEWRIWKTPKAFTQAYYGTLRHFYLYFADAAEERAGNGQKSEALRAIGDAARVFPLRAAFHVLRPSPIHRAVRRILSPTPKPTPELHSAQD
ncbi:MAG: glycosyltransferase family A protein [Pseudomonadota bacterium]